MVDKKQIRLEFAPNNAYINHRDKYGRLLAYVYTIFYPGFPMVAYKFAWFGIKK